jgi:hypothetical protein
LEYIPIYLKTTIFDGTNDTYMIRSLFKLALFLVAGILIYNYFFGTSEEQDQSKVFFGKVRDVVVTGADLLKSEKHKYDAGKYDKLMDNLGVAYKAVRQRAQFVDEKVLKRLDELETRKAQLKQELDSIQEDDQQPASTPQRGLRQSASDNTLQTSKAADQQRRKEALQQEMEKLYQDSEILLRQAQEQL